MKPEFVRPARFAGSFSTRLKAVSVLTILGLALTGCGSLFGDDAPDTSAPLGAVVGPERNDKGLTGVGRVSQAAAVESIAGGFVVSDEPQASLAARNGLGTLFHPFHYPASGCGAGRGRRLPGEQSRYRRH